MALKKRERITPGKKCGYFKTSKNRLIVISLLTVFFTFLITINIFFFSFKEELLSSAVEMFLQKTSKSEIDILGLKALAPNRYFIEGAHISLESFDLSSGPATIEFKVGLNPFFPVKKIIIDNPTLSIKLSGEDESKGKKGDLINRIIGMDIVIRNAKLDIAIKDKDYRFSDLDLIYKRVFGVGLLSVEGETRTYDREGVKGVFLNGHISGVFSIKGKHPDLTAKGYVISSVTSYELGDLNLSAEEVAAVGSFGVDGIKISKFRLKGFQIIDKKVGVDVKGITSKGKMVFLSGGPLIFNDVFLEIPELGMVTLDELLIKNGFLEIKATTDDLKVSSKNLKKLGSLIPRTFENWELNGKSNVEFSVSTTKTKEIEAVKIVGEIKASLHDLSFSSPGWEYMGEGLDGTVEYSWVKTPEEGFVFNGLFFLKDFQLLLGDFYLNFDDNRVSGQFEGTISDESDLRDLTLDLSIPKVLSMEVSGDIRFQSSIPWGNLKYSVKSKDIGPLFDLIFKNFFKERIPSLYDAKIEGSLQAKGRLQGNFLSPEISGSLNLDVPYLDIPGEKTKIEGLLVDMPFSIDFSETIHRKKVKDLTHIDFGTVRIKNTLIRGIEVGEMKFLPALTGNSLTFSEDLKFELLDGEVMVKDFIITNITSEQMEMGFSLSIRKLNIGKIFTDSELLRFHGELSGDLSEVGIKEKKLFTSGDITAKMFGGVINFENIWGYDLLNTGRKIGLDVRFNDIDLDTLTEVVNVGKITGVVDGSISDLVFAYGDPQSFVFDIYTVDKSRVKKKVSVDFIDNMTILGSGSNIFSMILQKGLNRFISEYNYSEIGIHMELKNDFFKLNGKIQSDGTEYFIKRRGLTGINIINQNPHNQIRFKDMMERVNRIKVKNKEDIKIETK